MTFCLDVSRPNVFNGTEPARDTVPTMDDLAVAYGAEIKRLRDLRKLSQDELGDLVGLTGDAIGKIERGERATQWVKFAKLCRVLDTTPNSVLGFEVVDPDLLTAALLPILTHFRVDPNLAPSIARILIEALQAAQSEPDDTSAELRYRLAGQIAAARFPRK